MTTVLMAWLGCNSAPQPTPVSTTPAVRSVEVQATTFADAFLLSGTLEAAQTALLFPGAPGRVREVAVRIGDTVEEGDVLLTLEAGAYAAGVTQAKAALAMAQAQGEQAAAALSRYEALKARNAVTDAEFEGVDRQVQLSEAQVAQAEAALAGARQVLYDATLRAPFDGVIIGRHANPGDMIGAAAPRPPLQIADLSSFRVKTAASELIAGRITPGLSLSVTVDAVPEVTWTATVERVNAAVDPVTRTVAVEARLDADPRLRHGMAASVALQGVGEAFPAVPRGALLDRDDGTARVWVLDGDVVRAQAIRYGRSQQDLVPVLSGLMAGDRVLVAGHTRLRDGDRVRDVP